MGIKQLFKVIKDKAPNSYREVQISVFTSKTVALDASKTIYQFVVSTTSFQNGSGQGSVMALMDSEGNPTGHLLGFIYKSLLFLEQGIQPIWVFDGIPPEAKKLELKKRREKKLEAKKKLDEAKDLDNAEEQLKQAQRNVKVTPQMTEDAIQMLKLMGIPVFKAKGEAEAQCVKMLKQKIVQAVASDDMDCLTFGCETLIKGVRTKNDPVIEITLSTMLKEMNFTMDQFIDFCILSGSDYLPTIPKFGPLTAYKYISEHKNIETVLKVLQDENEEYKKTHEGKSKYIIPQDYDFNTARDLFKNPDVETEFPKLEVQQPDEEKLLNFLRDKKGFQEERVNQVIKRLKQAKKKKPQMTLESFFGRPKVVKKIQKNIKFKSSKKKKIIKQIKFQILINCNQKV